MRTFTLIWCGQLVSTIGSYMTFFALTLWAWDETGSATALVLIGFFFQLPQIPTTLFAGLIVDRFNRKRLMLLGDAIIALTTATIGVLHFTQQLQIWHLYWVAILAGGFGQIQVLAYQASVSLIVPKQHYTRAGSMAAMVHYGSNIAGPALAGALYPTIGLSGIIVIDLTTFLMAFLTLLAASIPQPPKQAKSQPEKQVQRLTFGLRYIWQQPGLKALLLITVLFTFAHDLGGALHSPMILARTDGDAQVLASISAAAGVGGMAGAVIMTIWGGPQQRIRGLLGGYIGAGLSKIVFGLGRSIPVWIPAQVCSSLNFPLLGSCRSALWMDKIPSEIQGRVFAANSLVVQTASAVAVLLAGPLADRVLEPAMRSGGIFARLLSPSFGSGSGAGMAVLYTLCALAMLFIGIGGFSIPQLRAVGINTPDAQHFQ
ncbi:MAG: MFS transporter [Leptolyngbya sp. SIO4C5]|nr:MFS transporter [Leptolyngbya sp. SIO4C5]